MIDPQSDDTLLTMLRAADPATALPMRDGDLESLLAAVTATPRARRRRRLVWIAFGIASLLALGAATPAVAVGIRHLAETGWFGGSPNPPGVGARRTRIIRRRRPTTASGSTRLVPTMWRTRRGCSPPGCRCPLATTARPSRLP